MNQKNSSDSKRFTFYDIDIDNVPEDTASALKLSDPHKQAAPEFQEILEYLPSVRKFQKESDSVPLYLVFGCMLLENLIEHENAMVYAEIKKALRFLQAEFDKRDEHAIYYKEVDFEFEEMIQAIQKERFRLEDAKHIAFDITTLIKYFYLEVIPNSNRAEVLTIAVRALFLAAMKQDKTLLTNEIFDHVLREPYMVSHKFVKDLCQVLAKKFSMKIDIIDANMKDEGREKISKTEIHPNPKNKDFTFHVALLNFAGTTKGFIGFGYPTSAKGNNRCHDPPINNQSSGDKFKSNTKNLNPHESKMSSQKPIEEDVPKLMDCSLCAAPLDQKDVFLNKNCGHAYCIYCLEEIDSKYYSLCFLKKCPAVLASDDIRKFVLDWNERQKQPTGAVEESKHHATNGTQKAEKPNDSGQREPIEVKSCSYCKMLKETNKMFENSCGHIFCLDCIERASKGSYCPMAACMNKINLKGLSGLMEEYTQTLKNDILQGFIDDFKEGKIDIQDIRHSERCQNTVECCALCRAQVNEDNAIKNPGCKHAYCRLCLERLDLKVLPVCVVRGCNTPFTLLTNLNNVAKNEKSSMIKEGKLEAIIENIKECTICSLEFPKVKCLPCAHCFHSECITAWLKKDLSCPICRLTYSESQIFDKTPG